MKKIIFLLTLVLIVSCVNAQVHNPVTTKPLIDYPTVPTSADEDYVPIWDMSFNALFKWRLSEIKAFVQAQNLNTSSDHIWTAYNNFSSGKLSIPNYHGSPYHLNEIMYRATDSTVWMYVKDGANDKFLISLATQHYHNTRGSGSGGSGMDLTSNQTFTGIKTTNNGGISIKGLATLDFGIDEGSKLILPTTQYLPVGHLELGRLHYIYSNHSLWVGEGVTEKEVATIPRVEEKIDELIITDVFPPTLATNGSDTLDWSIKNYAFIADIPPEGPQTYIFKNYAPNQYVIMVKALNNQEINFEFASGITKQWVAGGKPTNWGGSWLVNFVAAKANEVWISATKF